LKRNERARKGIRIAPSSFLFFCRWDCHSQSFLPLLATNVGFGPKIRGTDGKPTFLFGGFAQTLSSKKQQAHFACNYDTRRRSVPLLLGDQLLRQSRLGVVSWPGLPRRLPLVIHFEVGIIKLICFRSYQPRGTDQSRSTTYSRYPILAHRKPQKALAWFSSSGSTTDPV
jgi:hypothetical protein